MLDRLVEIIQQTFTALLPFVVLEPFERGVLTRLGKVKGELGPGFHWCYPLHIDSVWHEHVTPRTARIAGLSTTTTDGKAVGFDAVITYRITDITKAIMEVTDLQDALADSCAGIIGTQLSNSSWDDIRRGDAVESLSAACRKRGWRWGVEIMSVQLTGFAVVKNIRLAIASAQHAGHQGNLIE
jgi:regulator of protease activity HflC (stomatin/prohibitin superfamily)